MNFPNLVREIREKSNNFMSKNYWSPNSLSGISAKNLEGDYVICFLSSNESTS